MNIGLCPCAPSPESFRGCSALSRLQTRRGHRRRIYVPNDAVISANESRTLRRPVFSTKRADGFLLACYSGSLPLRSNADDRRVHVNVPRRCNRYRFSPDVFRRADNRPLLKRNAGVKLGFFYQIFCLTLAFYAAIRLWRPGRLAQSRRRRPRPPKPGFIVALRQSLSLGLLLREKVGKHPIPHFLRESLPSSFFSSLSARPQLWLSCRSPAQGPSRGFGHRRYHFGFAGQNLFGGIIAGIQLQISRPFRVGDWLQVGERFAEVMEINWRSTRLRTNDDIYLDIPNNEIVRETIVNLHYPTQVHAMRIRVGIDYKTPPNRVKDALMRATKNAELVLRDPPAKIFLVDFADHAVIYEIKFYMGNHAGSTR